MIKVRRADERGYFEHGWLKSHYSFSFGPYFDQDNMGFGALRVLNEELVDTRSGLGLHEHHNMEILSYVIKGSLTHEDNLGNRAVCEAGDIQCVSAGRGLTHSEFNHSTSEDTQYLQIWLEPVVQNTPPHYQHLKVLEADKRGKLHLLASPVGKDKPETAIGINSRGKVFVGLFNQVEAFKTRLDQNTLIYVHVCQGQVNINGQTVSAGDAVMLEDERNLEIKDGVNAEVLVFELEFH